ncbi:hypothetical protein [uncultured Shewanella sp.]|uniref:hypothetical protein n=1 Tax=uncultured Shewanella sp. TaxID=173975 RepID=UPI0026271B58|nr:hypothetical protein [uncultured Shewanella sp.]
MKRKGKAILTFDDGSLPLSGQYLPIRPTKTSINRNKNRKYKQKSNKSYACPNTSSNTALNAHSTSSKPLVYTAFCAAVKANSTCELNPPNNQ